MSIPTGMTIKLSIIKKLTIILISCVLSFFIIDFASRDLNGDFRNQLNAQFKESMEISFDYRTKNDYRKHILESYAKKYHFSYYCLEYRWGNESNLYSVYDPSNRITLKKYDIGAYFNKHYIHDVRAMTDKQYFLTNYFILFDSDRSVIEEAFSNTKEVRIIEASIQQNHHVEGSSRFVFLLQTALPYVIILLILYLMIELAIYEKQRKEYALKKIHGMSVFSILRKTYFFDYFSVTILYWLTNLIFVYGLGYNGNDNSYILKMSAMIYVLLLVPFILIDVLESIGVHFLRIKNALKNKVSAIAYDAVSIAFKFISQIASRNWK